MSETPVPKTASRAAFKSFVWIQKGTFKYPRICTKKNKMLAIINESNTRENLIRKGKKDSFLSVYGNRINGTGKIYNRQTEIVPLTVDPKKIDQIQ